MNAPPDSLKDRIKARVEAFDVLARPRAERGRLHAAAYEFLLFSGFMYACIGSYIARAWRLFEFRFVRFPPLWAPWLLAILAYANFFTHHFIPDVRIGLFVFSVVIFGRAWIVFTPDRTPRRMPLLVSSLLASLFIWIAENLGTFANAWIYPSQRSGWTLVPITKLGAWYLLINLSFVLVTIIHRPETETPRERRELKPKGRPAY